MITLTYSMSEFKTLSNLIAAAGTNMPVAASRALNHTGAKAKTLMARSLVGQTGLLYRTTSKALKLERSTPATLTAAVYSKGGDISLKFFKAKEQGSGVSAAPFNARQQFSGGFIKGGRAGNRVKLKMGGHVYKRVGPARLSITKVKSGVIIPEEMVEGASRDAFFTVVSRDLPARLAHEIYRVL